MIDLESIDLTQNKRFESIVNKEESEKLYKIRNDDRGIYRLKKGEIPHYSSHINIGLDTSEIRTTIPINTITFDNLIVDAPVIDMSSVIASWSTDFNTTTTSIFSNNITWDNADDIDNQISTNTIPMVRNYTTKTIYEWCGNNTYDTSSFKDKEINERISVDPFYDDQYIFGNIHDRLKKMSTQKEFEIEYDSYYDRSSIFNRLDPSSTYHNHMKLWLNNYFSDQNLIDRLDDSINNTIVDSTQNIVWNQNRTMNEDKLKQRAPFIKRVYVTNRGYSFDSDELNFDMVLAAEHFDAAINNKVC